MEKPFLTGSVITRRVVGCSRDPTGFAGIAIADGLSTTLFRYRNRDIVGDFHHISVTRSKLNVKYKSQLQLIALSGQGGQSRNTWVALPAGPRYRILGVRNPKTARYRMQKIAPLQLAVYWTVNED